MKNVSLLFLLSFFIMHTMAQTNIFPSNGSVGIGTTTPNASAKLEINATGRGLLIPRMSQSQRNAIASPATSLLIYQTNNTPGFYYYTGSTWRALSPSGFWSLKGNSGTTSSNFLGTTDVQPLRFRVNNKNSGIIDYNLGTAAFGYLALNSNTAVGNTAVGYEAGFFNTTGQSNTALGGSALSSNTTGSNNLASGYFSLYVNSTGSYNTALGEDALSSNNGSNNIAVGALAGHTNTSGGTNIFIGYNAGNGSQTGSGNICIGQGTTVSDGISNSIVIGNSLSTSNSNAVIVGGSSQNVGMGTVTPYSSSQLSVNSGSKYYSVYAEDHYTNGGIAVIGTTDHGGGYGLDGTSTGATSTAINIGTYGYAANSTFFVTTPGSEFNGYGNYGIYGESGDGFAGGFNGDIAVYGDVYSSSDAKLKKNIQQLNNALNRLKLLPVKEFDFDKDYAKQNQLNFPTQHQFGFIAQDVAKIFPNLVTGITAPVINHSSKNGEPVTKHSTGFLAVNYISFIPLLTKAVQELSAQNDSIKNENTTLASKVDDLQNQINDLKKMIVSNQSTVNSQQSTVLSSASLSQNIPNPFSNSTTINYSLPQKFSSAKIIVTDKNGNTLKQINISAGKGSVNVDAATLSSGAYQYSLYIDGKRIDTKQMILAK